MLAKRIIACLDVRNGRVVKGRQFVRLKDQGNPATRAAEYERQGADEIVLLDVSATRQKRLAFCSTVRQVASVLQIPLTVGGGIRTLDDAEKLFRNGADKVSLNTAVLENPSLIRQLADAFGTQAVVVAIDAKKEGSKWKAYSRAGTRRTSWDAGAWANEAQRLGAGEILLTSMDADGMQRGFDLGLLVAVQRTVNVPVVASGGAGTMRDFWNALQVADAALGASTLHSGKIRIPGLKQYLKRRGVTVRP